MTIDVNVNLSRWPFRRLRGDEPAELAAMLRQRGVERAWAGSYDALLHKDISAVNARLADDCNTHGEGLFMPVGSVNPTLPDWEEGLRRCHEVHGMRAIRLHPGYHGYGFDDERFTRLIGAASEQELIVQIALRMEDVRTQHPMLRVATPDVAPLIDVVQRIDGLRVLLLNTLMDVRGDRLTRLAATGRVWFDIATLEGTGGVRRVIDQIGVERVLFGTHSPFFYTDAAFLKLRESALSEAEERAIRTANAAALLGPV